MSTAVEDPTVINVSAKFFKLITKQDATVSTINRQLHKVLERIDSSKTPYKVCIMSISGKAVWFDHEGNPTEGFKRKLPSLKEQMKGVSQAAIDSFNNFKVGNEVRVSEEEKERRLDICGTCELYDATRKKCTKCGCNMPWKTALASAHCPHPDGDKWSI